MPLFPHFQEKEALLFWGLFFRLVLGYSLVESE
jgi:hypothetical protein